VTTIDAHHHLWRYRADEYSWMGPGMEALKRDHLVADLAPLARAAGVTGTVAVQARRLEVETPWLLAIADAEPLVRGVVGWVDPEAPDVAERVAHHARHPALVGFREVLHDLPDVDYATSPGHLRLVEAVGRADLAYDLLLRPAHLPAAIRLVDRFPAVRFVVDHVAKPVLRGPDAAADGPARAAWRAGLRALAERPNVACKLSGVLTEADWASWTVAQAVPVLEDALEAFGPERCMIGSDWPVCTLAAPYGTTLQLAFDVVDRLTDTERAQVRGGTATTWYRLPPMEEQP
jgi:L-fuconolactonase